METTASTHRPVLCRLGRHHDIPVNDENPENRRAYHLECTRCLRAKDLVE